MPVLLQVWKLLLSVHSLLFGTHSSGTQASVTQTWPPGHGCGTKPPQSSPQTLRFDSSAQVPGAPGTQAQS